MNADQARAFAEAAVAKDYAGPEATSWPTLDLSLLKNETAGAPSFPANLLSPQWGRWVYETAETAGSAPDYVLAALLSTASTLIGNSRWGSPWPGWAEPTAINMALVGRPSSGKSPAMDALTSALASIETDLNLDWNDRRRRHTTKLTEAREYRALWEREVKEAVKLKLPPPEMPIAAQEPDLIQRRRILSTETTIEKAARLSAGNAHGLLLVRDELAGWICSMDRYTSVTGGDRAFWVQAYGGRPWIPDRVKDGEAGIHISHLLWSVVGGIQPDRLASLLLYGDDDGLAARFFYIWPAPKPPTRPQILPSFGWAQEGLHRLRRLPWTPPEPTILPFSPAAANCMQAWREEVAAKEEGASGLFLSWLGKLPGMALRIATVLEHLAWTETNADPPEQIGEAAMMAGADFLEGYGVPMARRTFGEAALPQTERDVRRLARWLVRRQPVPDRLNARELRRMPEGPGLPDAERTEATLGELAEAGWVRRAPPNRAGVGGRSRSDWMVNPALREACRGMA